MTAPVLILYATVSGNAEQLARAAAAALCVRGRLCIVENAADFPAARLREFDAALVIASTWGEGEPPPDAVAFYAALAAPAIRLESLRYAVLALGSSSYRDFCAGGRLIDERLAARGARRLLSRRDCDTKFKADFQEWLPQVDAALNTPA
ncbi:MAG: flavodoxin domain-containing protein [Opitutae bacterium]|nr:flavodoxin domain-containing protein [Opitutae bacterium]